MRKYVLIVMLAAPLFSFSQIGIKAGVNFANITKVSAIDNSSRSGFNVAIFLSPSSRSIISSRTELMFSRQGYNYSTNTNTGHVDLDYLMLPQFMAINITKYFQVQLGAQVAYLLNAKVDSTHSTGTSSYADRLMDLYNRVDFGFGGGLEVHPVSGLLVGARMNVSLGKLYKDPQQITSAQSFIPKVNVRNNVFQLYAGWRFGKN